LEFPNDPSSLIRVSDYFAIRGRKEWQNSLNKAFAIDALQKK